MPRKSRGTKERQRLFAKYEGVCYLCNGVINDKLEAWEIEHVIPLKLGGGEDYGRRSAAADIRASIGKE